MTLTRRAAQLLSFLLLLVMGACVSSQLHYTHPSFRGTTRPELNYTTPLSAVGLMVGEQVPQQPDWFLSALTSRKLKPTLLLCHQVLNLKEQVPIDSLDRLAYITELGRVLRHVARKSPDDSLHSPLLQETVQASPQRYTLVLLCRGFTRAADSYARANARSQGSALVYGVYRVPIKARISLTVLVYDRQRQQVVYAQSSTEEHEPTNARDILRHLQHLMGNDFYFSADFANRIAKNLKP